MSDESRKEEILINVSPSETRAALLENGVLQEIFIERTARRGLISNIYNGRVTRVLPGMQAAFVEIGLDRTAFLHASDIARNGNPGDAATEELPDIRELVREGDRLLVQVVKDPLGNKGARLTTFITLPSRHLVLLPRSASVGIEARASAFRRASTRTESVSVFVCSSRNCWLSTVSSAVPSCGPSRRVQLATHWKPISSTWSGSGVSFRNGAGTIR
jgi:ribonuclease G